MSLPIARQRCWTHPLREAVSRCPSCKRFYCRECVTEHDGRLLCVACLKSAAPVKQVRSGTRWALWIAAAAAGFLLAFLLFYSAGYMLQQVPPSWAAGDDE